VHSQEHWIVARFADRSCSLFELRAPMTVESDGSEDDWDVIRPAMVAAATRHLSRHRTDAIAIAESAQNPAAGGRVQVLAMVVPKGLS
jgi:hypothetical protein